LKDPWGILEGVIIVLPSEGPGRDSLQKNNYNNFPFWVLKGSPERASKICLKKGKNIGYLKDP
jgi:hypothetical protein